VGGKFHLKLNICGRPIANKYREGKMKRTLKRELKVPEIAKREANGISLVQLVPVYETVQALVLIVRLHFCFLVVYGIPAGCRQHQLPVEDNRLRK
jgi:hypothetical protein